MDLTELQALLDAVSAGSLHPTDALVKLRHLHGGDLTFAQIDHHRLLRQGFAETVYGPGKTPHQVAEIVVELLGASGAPVIASRLNPDQVESATKRASARDFAPPTITWSNGHATVVWRAIAPSGRRVSVVTAGTADLPVAYECVAVLEALGFEAHLLADRGVAGLQRILAVADTLLSANAVVVVAGMEGALASVIGGLCGAPVIAVPTSVGYGSSLDGVTALLSMLASCANGITVVGIDNGYGAAMAVARILGVKQ